jgi:hypothetical protein
MDVARDRTLRFAALAVIASGAWLAPVLVEAQAPADPARLAPKSWGTAAGATTLMGHDLPHTYSNIQNYLGASYCSAYPDPLDPLYAVGQMNFPDGATLSQLQLWAYDTDASDGLNVTLWETCQAPGFNAPSSTQLATIDTFGAIGTYFGFTPLNGHRVDARNCAYTVKALFNPGSICKGEAIQLQKVQVSWVRDVAPAPASASFGDVPPAHPFFQFIEALAASGVTGGCGNGDFCPDQPLTRGQMAVFLSKALGLEWP